MGNSSEGRDAVESPRLGERELFERCLELPKDEREAFLRSQAGEEGGLVERVIRLLAAHEGALREPTMAAAARVGEVEPDPERIGPFRVIERLGQGGMGVVYLAEQEEPIRRTVAVKIIKLGLDTAEVIDRFVAERQALALMTHPNIARILDAGATERGRPYFVMEYVRDGRPITQYCDERGLGLRERLRLFQSVCRAAHHAHQNGVIHRDLKPSNILVTEEDGMPFAKVIDFGVAKALFAPLTPNDLETHPGGVIGTPAYMSPEQRIAGAPVDSRSDIYSLGAVLYELLAGARVVEDADAADVPQWVAPDVPAASSRFKSMPEARASAVAAARDTTAGRLLRHLRGDLDFITARALERSPDERYSSAAALAHDLDLVLSQRPVTAAPQRLLYRAEKALRRHRTRVLTAVTLLSLSALVFLEARRLPVLGPHEASVVVLPLDDIGEQTRTLADGLHESLITELSQLRDVGVVARGSVLSYRGSGLTPEAIGQELGVGTVLEGTVQRVVDRLRVTMRLVRTSDGVQVWSEQYDRPYQVDGLLDMQRDIAGDVARSLSATLLPERPAPTRSMDALLAFYEGNAHYTGRYERAETDLAIEAFQRAVAEDPDFGAAYAALARAHIWRFWQFAEGGDRAPAEAALARARALAPGGVETRLAEGFVTYRLHRDFEQALTYFLDAERSAPGDASLQEAIGYVQRRLGHWDQALERMERAAQLQPRRPGLIFSIGHTHHMLRNFDQAAEWFRRLTLVEPRPGPNGPFEARADLYASRGDTAAMRAMLEEVPTDADELRRSLRTTLAYYGRRYEEALEEGGRLRAWPFSRDVDSSAGQAILHHLAGHSAARDSIAIDLRLSAERELVERAPEEINARARVYGRLALGYALSGNREEALRAARASRSTLSLAIDAYSGRYGEQRLAAISMLVGNHEEAIELLEQLLTAPNELTPALLALDPRSDALRGEPRFEFLVSGG